MKISHEVSMHISRFLKVKMKVTSHSCSPLKCISFMDIYLLTVFLSLPESAKNMDLGFWRQESLSHALLKL